MLYHLFLVIVPLSAATVLPRACPAGQTECEGVKDDGTWGMSCVDMATNMFHCGACGEMCSGFGAVCKNGACTCGSDSTPACMGWCPDVLNDQFNCGSCDNQCSQTERCDQGQCKSCPAGQNSCWGTVDYQFYPYQCVDLQTDSNNCNECGNKCEGNCVGGECECPEGRTRCGYPWHYKCMDTNNDPNNCGGCYSTCPYQEGLCVNGKCVSISCPPGQQQCGEGCVNIMNDNRHCGECGWGCVDGKNCVDGKCVGGPGGCPPRQSYCFRTGCINTDNDNRHCGECGKKCDAGKNCVGGKCT